MVDALVEHPRDPAPARYCIGMNGMTKASESR